MHRTFIFITSESSVTPLNVVSGLEWSESEQVLFKRLGSCPIGLTESSAVEKYRRAPRSIGIVHATGLRLVLRQFVSPVTLILLGVSVVSAVLGEMSQSLIVLTIVGISALLGFLQERGAVRAVQTLLGTVSVHADVLRGGREREVALAEVVPGDVVVLRSGDVVPGDGRVLRANQLRVDESALTGEAFPRSKTPGILGSRVSLAERTNMVHLGSYVASGEGHVLVTRTGTDTEFGRISGAVASQHLPTAFERGVTAFGLMLMRTTLVLVTAICLVNLAFGRPVGDSILFSLALAVGLMPQMLPAIVTVGLSRGAQAMAKSKVIVKRLDAIEDVGGLDILCTDKTGTITLGSVAVRDGLDPSGYPDPRVLQWAWLTARYQRGFPNPLDDAILDAVASSSGSWTFNGEVPFDFVRKRMSVLLASENGSHLVTKGAFESLFERCSFVESRGSVLPVEAARAGVMRTFERLSGSGLRLLGVAYKSFDADGIDAGTARTPTQDDEHGLTFVGFLGFADPPKPGARHAIEALAAMGVSVRIITGDNRLAAAFVASQVGLEAGRAATGSDVAAASDQELVGLVERTHVFSEVDPIQKGRIVRAYSRGGHTVGFLGDGINDSPALHAADVGISVDSAVDVAKQTADLVLLTKDLGVLAEGIKRGRRIFVNTQKYVHVTTSANFGNMVSLAAATLFLPFLPMLPLQVLLLNFLSDIPGLTIAGDDVDEELTRLPCRWEIGRVRSFMLVFGLTSTVFDLFTFGVLRMGFAAEAELLRSGWFVESMLTELAALLMLRTSRRVWRSRPGPALLASSLLAAAVAVALPYSSVADDLGLVGLPLRVALALAAVTAGYVVVSEAFKSRFAHLTEGRS